MNIRFMAYLLKLEKQKNPEDANLPMTVSALALINLLAHDHRDGRSIL